MTLQELDQDVWGVEAGLEPDAPGWRPAPLFPAGLFPGDTTETRVLTRLLLFAPPFQESKAGCGSGTRQLRVRMQQGAGLLQGTLRGEWVPGWQWRCPALVFTPCQAVLL